jgi:hypothetical protein
LNGISGNLNGQLKQFLFRPMTRFQKQGAAMKQRKASVAPASTGTAQRNPAPVATGSVGQTSVPAQAMPQPKTVAIKSGQLPQIFRRLSAIGFNCTSDGRYVNPSPGANIQEIAWGRDRIEDNCVWLVVSARKPFAYALAAMERFAQRRQAELERKLRLAKEYWLRIQPFIKDRPLRNAELYVATDAHFRLRQAAGRAAEWNRTEEGRRFSVPVEALPDFGKDPFLEPEELCRDENLKPETLAAIAAPMMQKRTAELTPLAAIGVAHELLLAAERYVKALPEQKRGTERLMDDFDKAFSTVTFTEIKASNPKSSGKLPLLPPSGQKRKNISEQEQREEPLSVPAIREAVKRYLDEHTPRLTQEEYERDQEQTERLAKEGKLVRLGSGKTRTYQEWQSDNQKAIDDCMENSRVSLQDLCKLRWERFERQWNQRQLIASNRKTPRRKPRKQRGENSPSSAASSPQTAGKPEKRPPAKTVKKISRAPAGRLP